MPRITAGILLFCLVLTGCAASKSATDAPPAHNGGQVLQPVELSAYDRVLQGVKPDGGVDLSTAIAAFSVAIAQLPGAPPPAGPRRPVRSGTSAVRWIEQHWAGLTAAQRQAVTAALELPAAGQGGMATPVKAPASTMDCHRADNAKAAELRPVLDRALADLTAKLNYRLRGPVTLVVNSRAVEGDSLAYAVDCATSGRPACTIHINPKTVHPPYDANSLRVTMVHEATHCVMNDRFPGRESPGWLEEGFATFAETQLSDWIDRLSTDLWHIYLETDTGPLFARNNTAVGFFAFLQHNGVDVWSKVFDMHAAYHSGGNKAAWRAAGITDAILDNWGSSYAMGRRPGQPWTIKAPGAPNTGPQLVHEIVRNGTEINVAAPATATHLVEIDMAADVVRFAPTANARGRLGPDGQDDRLLASLDGVDFCARPGGCSCPASSPHAGAAFTNIASKGLLGVTGGLNAASVRVTGVSLEDFCNKPKHCLVGTWRGDPVRRPSGTGGEGTVLIIRETGEFSWNFDPMKPLPWIGSVVLRYNGTITGKVALREPPGPVSGKFVATNLSLNGATMTLIDGGQTETTPLPKNLLFLFWERQYECAGNTLRFVESSESGWPFTRQ